MKFASYDQFNADLRAQGVAYAAAHAKATGFDGVEFLDTGYLTGEYLPDRYDAGALGAALAKEGLTVACYSAYTDLWRGDFEMTFAALCRMIDFAAALKAPLFHHTLLPSLANAPEPLAYDRVFDDIFHRVLRIASYCEKRGLCCLFEPQGMYFNGKEGLGRLLSAVKMHSSNVGLCADCGNTLFVDEDAARLFTAFAMDIAHVHVKDYRLSATQPQAGKFYRSKNGAYLSPVPLFEGDVDLKNHLRIIQDSGYNGFISLEFTGSDSDMLAAIAKLNAVLNQN